MQFIKTSIPDIILIKPKLHKDIRGYFFEDYHKEEFDKRDVRIIAISQFEWDQKDADRMTKLGIEAYFDFTGKYFKKNAKFLQSSIPLTVIYDINGDKIFTKTGAPVVLKGMDPNAPDYTQKVSDAMLNNPSLLDLDIAKYLDILNN